MSNTPNAAPAPAPPAQFDAGLLDILACPACDARPPLTLSSEPDERTALYTLDCPECGRRYPVERSGIPVLLVEQALPPLPVRK